MRDASLVSGGELSPDLTEDWAAVQDVQAGGAGHQGNSHHCLWGHVSHSGVVQPDQTMANNKVCLLWYPVAS